MRAGCTEYLVKPYELERVSSALAHVPKVRKALAGRDAEVALNLAEALDDHDDVQNVYADFDISDEELASLASAG